MNRKARIGARFAFLLAIEGWKLFKHEEEMYRIKIEDYNLNLLARSFVLYTSTSDCPINFFSPDQIGMLRDSANAKYKISLPCGQISFALENLLEKSFVGTHLIRDFSNFMNKSNSASENPESFISLCTFFSLLSSSNNLDGAYNLTLSENNISNFFVCMPLPLAIIAENNSLASVTKDIIYSSGYSDLSSLYMDSSISEASSFAPFSVNLDLEAKASNTALCNAFDLDKCISNAFAMINSLASFDSSEYDFSISSFNSDGTLNLITTSVILSEYSKMYINVSNIKIQLNKVKAENETLGYLRNSLNSFVLNILTRDCFLKAGSFDQIAQLSFNASANIGTSFSCIRFLASFSNSLNKSFGTISMNFAISYNTSLNCSELIIIDLTGLNLKKEINILVSMTICISYQPSFLYLSHIPSLILSPSLKQSCSVSSEFSSILSSFFNSKALFTFSDKNLRTASDQFVSGNLSISFFNSSGIDNVMFGILYFNSQNIVNTQIYKSFAWKAKERGEK